MAALRGVWCVLMAAIAVLLLCTPSHGFQITRRNPTPVKNPKSPARLRLEKLGKKMQKKEPKKDNVDNIIKKIRDNAVNSSQLMAPGETFPNKTKANIAKTLDGLGRVLRKMHSTITADEAVFVAFKRKLLENELAQLNTEASWPAIKDLVKSEVSEGRTRINNELANFKVRLMDLVQSGLNNLRADLRGNVDTKIKGKLNVGVKKGRAARATAPNAQKLLADSLRRLPISPENKRAIVSYATKVLTDDVLKKRNGTKPEKASRSNTESYGESALNAIRDLQKSLEGSVSMKDLKSEIYSRLSTVTQQYLKHPTPAGAQALKELNHTIVASLKGLEKAELDRQARDAKYHALRTKAEKQQQQKQQEKKKQDKAKAGSEEKDSIDMTPPPKDAAHVSHAVHSPVSSKKKKKPTFVDDALARAEKVQQEGDVTRKVTNALATQHKQTSDEVKSVLKPRNFRFLESWRRQNPQAPTPNAATLNQLAAQAHLKLSEVKLWFSTHKPAATQRHIGNQFQFLQHFDQDSAEASTSDSDISARLAELSHRQSHLNRF